MVVYHSLEDSLFELRVVGCYGGVGACPKDWAESEAFRWVEFWFS